MILREEITKLLVLRGPMLSITTEINSFRDMCLRFDNFGCSDILKRLFNF